MFPSSTIILYKELKEWLRDFSDLVADKVLEKMPYSMWRHMSQNRADNSDVFIDWNTKRVEIYFPADPTIHHLEREDCSFGEFIFENYLENDDYWRAKQAARQEAKADYMSSQCTSSNNYTVKNYSLNIDDTLLSAGEKIKSAAVATSEEIKKVLAGTPIGLAPTYASDVSICVDTKVDKSEFNSRISELEKTITNHINKEENKNMNAFKFDFGPVNGNAVRMSMYGMAVKNKAGTWVSYDAKAGEIMDVDVFNFDGANFMYKMPVAMKDIAVGDVVIHHSAPMFVVGKSTDEKGLVVIDVIAGERKEVMLAKSPFGFNFATKVVNFLGNAFGGAATADNPFGNMWMLMAMSGDNKDMKDMLPFMMMANDGMDMSNPMMMYALMGKGDIDPMMLAFMSGAFNPAPAHECKCGGNCGEHHN